MKIAKLYNSNYLLIIILVVAAILRLNQINQPYIDAFSWRQSSTAMMADNYYRTNWNIFYPEVSWGGESSNYQGREFQTVSYISALLYTIFGQHDWIGRSVAVVFGLWGIFALYQLVRLVWDEKHALMSAAVMAILPGSIFIERSFLPDPAMVSLVTTSFWLLVVYLQTDCAGYLWLASAVGCWGFLSKIPGLIVGIPMFYATLSILGKRKKLYPQKIIHIAIAIVLMLTPVVAYYLWARHLAHSYPPYHFAGAGNWLWDWGLISWLKEYYFIPSLIRRFNNWLWSKPIIILFVTGLLISLVRYRQFNNQFSQTNQAPYVFHWWFIGCVIYYFIGAKELINNPWNFHIFSPIAAVFSGYAIIQISSISSLIKLPIFSSKQISAVVVLLIFLIIGKYGRWNLASMYKPYDYQAYKMGIALGQKAAAKDLVITTGNSVGNPISIYYAKKRGWTFPPAKVGTDWGKLPKNDSDSIEVFQELVLQGADWFAIVAKHKDELKQNYPKFMQYINENCQIVVETSDYTIYRIISNKNNTLFSFNSNHKL